MSHAKDRIQIICILQNTIYCKLERATFIEEEPQADLLILDDHFIEPYLIQRIVPSLYLALRGWRNLSIEIIKLPACSECPASINGIYNSLFVRLLQAGEL